MANEWGINNKVNISHAIQTIGRAMIIFLFLQDGCNIGLSCLQSCVACMWYCKAQIHISSEGCSFAQRWMVISDALWSMRFLFSISLAFLVFSCENWFGILWQSYSCVFSREALNVTALCRITIWLIGRFHSSRTIKPASPRSPTWSATMYKKTFSNLRIIVICLFIVASSMTFSFYLPR